MDIEDGDILDKINTLINHAEDDTTLASLTSWYQMFHREILRVETQ